MFSLILPIIDPFDRFVDAGVIQSLIERLLSLHGRFEVIIVINTPIAQCPKLTAHLNSLHEAHPDKIKVIEANENLGTARGFNRGLRESNPSSEYLIFVSSDADITSPNILLDVASLMNRDLTIGIGHPYSVWEDSDAFNASSKYSCREFYQLIASQSEADAGSLSSETLEALTQTQKSSPVECTDVMGTPLTFAVYRRSTIDAIGPFDEGILFGCYETDDLSYRALLAGYRVVRFNRLFVNHRRHLIRSLVLVGTQAMFKLPHAEAITQSSQWWRDKYKIPYVELYFKFRHGNLLYTLMLPWFRIRQLGGKVKRLLRMIKRRI